MIRLDKKYAMIIASNNCRLRLLKYEMPANFDKCAEVVKIAECNRLREHYKKCGKIIKAFMRAVK